MRITHHTQPSALEHYTDELTAVLSELSGQAFFLHPLYQKLWWQYLGQGELHVLDFLEENQLVGRVNFFIEHATTKKTLRLLGAKDETDYLNILASQEKLEPLTSELVKYLDQTFTEWQEIKLECLPADSLTLTLFAKKSEALGWKVSLQQQDVCPVVTLPTNWDEYLASLEPSIAKNFTRLMKNIGVEEEVSYSLVTTRDDVSQAASDFISLHKASSTEKASFWTPAREKFFTELILHFVKEDLLKLYFLEVDGERAAGLIIFDTDNQFLLYNSGFNQYRYGHMGVGNALILHTIQEAIKLGRTRYDFMRGDEKYKFTFGAKPEPVFDLLISKDS